MAVYIYGLVDPRTDELRYIGKTNNLKLRLRSHLNRRERNYKSNWIESLIREGTEPEIFVIEESSRETWEKDERFWISYFRAIGSNLTNIAVGGHDMATKSPEGWKRISSGQKMMTEETRRLSVRKRMKWWKSLGDEGRKEFGRKSGLGQIGKKVKEETKDKISAALVGRKSPQQSKMMSENNPMKRPDVVAKAKQSAKNSNNPGRFKKGYKMSEETRKKLSEIRTGRIVPESTRKKLSETHRNVPRNANGTFIRKNPLNSQ